MPAEYVGKAHLEAHFQTCPRCRAADLSSSRGLADLCIEGGALVKGYANRSRRALAADQGKAKRTWASLAGKGT